ncbi:MAG: hypothetical protein MJA82_02115 [Clostridia bacterium]|nr:hypothetical protein [Clostridia bacterium]
MSYYKITVTFRAASGAGEEDFVQYEDTVCRGLAVCLKTANSMFNRMLQENPLDEFTDVLIEKAKFVDNVLVIDKEVFYAYREYGKYKIIHMDDSVKRCIKSKK